MSAAEDDKRAPGSASFGDYTPTGLIINALSGDMSVYDEEAAGSSSSSSASAPKGAETCRSCGYRRVPGGKGACPGCVAKGKKR